MFFAATCRRASVYLTPNTKRHCCTAARGDPEGPRFISTVYFFRRAPTTIAPRPTPAAAHMLRQILLHPCSCGAIFLALVQAAREITGVSLCRSGSRANNASPLRCLLERSLQSAGSCSGPSGRGGSCGGPALRAPASQPAGQLLVRQQFIGRLSGEGRAGQTQQRDTGSSD